MPSMEDLKAQLSKEKEFKQKVKDLKLTSPQKDILKLLFEGGKYQVVDNWAKWCACRVVDKKGYPCDHKNWLSFQKLKNEKLIQLEGWTDNGEVWIISEWGKQVIGGKA